MKIMVTGASGFVGSAVLQTLLKSGHDVVGLVRSEGAAQAVTDLGATAHMGDVNDIDTLLDPLGRADAVIHTAFSHDFTKFAANCEADRVAILAMGQVLKDRGTPLVVTSAIGVLPQGQPVNENTSPVSGARRHL